jgi:hypothetical protein
MKRLRHAVLSLAALAVIVLVPARPSGQVPRVNESFFARLTWRNLGPFRTGAWTTAIAVPEAPLASHLYTFYVGTRNGGVWETTNNGMRFQPAFDAQPSLPIGAIAVAPSDEKTVRVGTGEARQARGDYLVTVDVDGRTFAKTARIRHPG